MDNDETIESMGIREWLIKQGAQKAQYNSKTVYQLEEAMADHEVSISATAREHIKSLEANVSQANAHADTLSKRLSYLETRYSQAIGLLEETELSLRDRAISDSAIIDGLNAFARMLESVRDTFGNESMTENVICAAINAASYGYWRSIMGPKTEGEAERRFNKKASKSWEPDI